MLNLPFILIHPTQVNLNQHPHCTLSGQQFPAYLAGPSPTPWGHQDVWELTIPLYPSIEMDSLGRVFCEPPYSQFYFLTKMCNLDRVEQLATEAKNRLEKEVSTGKII